MCCSCAMTARWVAPRQPIISFPHSFLSAAVDNTLKLYVVLLLVLCMALEANRVSVCGVSGRTQESAQVGCSATAYYCLSPSIYLLLLTLHTEALP